MKTKILFKFLILIPLITNAQWSNNPSVNTTIKNSSDWEIIPQVSTDADGNYYISWYSGTQTFNFNVYMQLLDKDGYDLWTDDGLLISDHQTNTWVANYQLLSDNEGNAVLSTQDWRYHPYFDVITYKVNFNGGFQWGDNGVTLTNESDIDNICTSVIKTPDNEFIYAIDNYPADTNQYSTISLQKLNSEGIPQWNNIELKNDTLYYYFAEMTMLSDSTFIITWLYHTKKDTSGTFGSHVFFHIAAQKFDINGMAFWPEPVRIDTGKLLPYDEIFVIPIIESDGNGGAFVCWQSGYNNGLVTTLVQRVNPDGSLAFEGPIQVSERNANSHWEPEMVYNEENEELFVFYVEFHHEGETDCWGVSGQKLSLDGQRLWSDTAIIFYDMQCNNYISIHDIKLSEGPDNDVAVFFIKDTFEIIPPDTISLGTLVGMRINSEGEYVWNNEVVVMSDYPGDKSKLEVSEFINGQWIATWNELRGEDDPSDYGIYAQNIFEDGSMGAAGVDEAGFASDINLRIYPNPFYGLSTIDIRKDKPGICKLSLFDLNGKLVQDLFNGFLANNDKTIELNGSALKTGIYILLFQTDNQFIYKKIVSF